MPDPKKKRGVVQPLQPEWSWTEWIFRAVVSCGILILGFYLYHSSFDAGQDWQQGGFG